MKVYNRSMESRPDVLPPDWYARITRACGATLLVLTAACAPMGHSDDQPDAAVSASAEPVPGPRLPEVTSQPAERYPVHEHVVGSIFWIGEPAGESNAYITNEETAWHSDPVGAFGGIDGPTDPNAAISGPQDIARDEHGMPTEFTPRFNPYYFALPANEFDEQGPIPGAREHSPWSDEPVADDESLFLGRWIKIWPVGDPERVTYGQWLDTGPFVEQDYEYVFGDGSQRPANEVNRSADNLGAGIDLSPAMALALGAEGGSGDFSWQFVDTAAVPNGPWSAYPPISNRPDWE